MKKLFSLLAIVSVIFIQGCLKDKTPCINKTVASEEATMQAYANTHNITYIRHPSGLYYQIINQGTGNPVNINSRVSVTYTGKLLDDTVFDQATSPTQFYPVTGFIAGWQIGLTFLNKGGTIRLLIPSSLAYGCTDAGGGSIPGNSILYFDVTVSDVQ
jgi:FKBP-type peptidyl-prolyl cis-trans isomerase FkpA